MNTTTRSSFRSSTGFTLIELIIVVGIIGILSSVLLVSFSGGTETARAAKCLSNMRNLAQAAIGYAARATDRQYPLAGSRAMITASSSASGIVYKEQRGWISWLSKNDEYGTHGGGGGSGGKGANGGGSGFVHVENVSAYSTKGDNEDATFAITNGVLWKAVNGNRDIYVCPNHHLVVTKKEKGVDVNWSYVMNAYFGYDWSDGQKATYVEGMGEGNNRVSLNATRLDRTLLFAELPFKDHDFDGSEIETSFSTSANNENDCVLQFKAGTIDGYKYQNHWSGKAESIAFNHKSGKRWCAHVAFADGHTEKLMLPTGGGLSKEDLTALLCGDDKRGGGKDIAFDGKTYSLIKSK